VKNRKFVDLAQLIQQYAQRGEKNGLVCPLLHPVNVDPADDDDIGRYTEFYMLSYFSLLLSLQPVIGAHIPE